MAVSKLSQIAAAGSAPALTDSVVGVTGGSTDNLFTLSQIQTTVAALPLAGNNITVYVATTGSDSNPGTMAQPFATLQHAFNYVAGFNYRGLYFPTINVAAGTYQTSVSSIAPELTGVNFNSNIGFLVGDTGTPTNVTLQSTTSNSVITFSGSRCFWQINGFQFDCPSGALSLNNFSQVKGTFWALKDSTAGNHARFADTIQNTSALVIQGTTLTYETANIQVLSVQNMGQSCLMQNRLNTIVLQPSTVFHSSEFIDFFSLYDFEAASITNGGSATGGGVSLARGCALQTQNAQFTDFPYTGNFSGDASCNFLGGTLGGTLFADQKAGLPTTSDIPPGNWTVVKDTSGGGVYVAYNDAGTIKKVALT